MRVCTRLEREMVGVWGSEKRERMQLVRTRRTVGPVPRVDRLESAPGAARSMSSALGDINASYVSYLCIYQDPC